MNEPLEGKTCVVTGANTGIGRATAEGLARLGARVIFACRSEHKARATIDEVRSATNNAHLEFHSLNLGSLKAAAESGRQLADRHQIDVLINNAGVAGQRGITDDGFELAFGVNHLGHFAFTTQLLDNLRKSGAARIVTVSSNNHYFQKCIDYDALRKPTQTVTGLREYGVSKLANVLFTKELARRMQGTSVTTYALNPGRIASDIWRRIPQPFRALGKMFMHDNEYGARTSVYCASDPQLAEVTGRYYDRCRERDPSKPSQSEEFATELWERSEAWCALSGPP